MKTGIAILFGLLLASASVPALAADEIGRVQVDGNEIIIYDDNSWEYSGDQVSAPDNCTKVASEVLPVSVCLDPDQWQLANLNGAEEHGFQNKNYDMYVLMITEKEVIEMDPLRNAILTNAQKAAKLNKVTTIEDEDVSVAGHPFGHIVYRTTVDGIDVTYSNHYTNFPGKGSLQIVAFAGSGQFDEVRPIINEVIAGISVDD